MNSLDPITLASMIGCIPSAWRARAVGIPIALAGWREPLWEAGIGGFAGAVADYPGSNQYRVRGLPLPFFIYRGDFLKSDANGPRLQKSSGIVEWELSGGGSLSSNSKGGARSGMPNLDYLLEIGPKAKITVAKPTDTSRLTVDVALREAISTNFSSRLRSQGALLEPDVAYEERAIFGSQWRRCGQRG
jgi:hypothetical protein